MANITKISSKSSNSSIVSIENPSDGNIHMRLRRLKIGESLLLKSINKSLKACERDSEVFLNNSNYNQFVTKVKSTCDEIKNLFADIKAKTCSQDNSKTLDVDDIKGDVLELEDKIRIFKSFLHIEMTSLKNDEQELQKQVPSNSVEIKRIKGKQKKSTKSYSEIIPSPVKALIQSPFKYSEVQQIQDFMANSKNRYGGWNAYNHNIFENCWQKYFGSEKYGNYFEYHEPNFEHCELFQNFIQEVLQKIPGIMADEIILHNEWFSKYVFLKTRQQRALDKWRANKKIIKKVRHTMQKPQNPGVDYSGKPDESQDDDQNELNILVSEEFKEIDRILAENFVPNLLQKNVKMVENFTRETTIKASKECEVTPIAVEKVSCQQKSGETAENKNIFGFLKPTLQWNNRCIQESLPSPKNFNVDKIIKR